jgi:serine/threonine-protein kinase
MRRAGPAGAGVGERIGPYRVEATLGEGAVGIVYRAVRETDGLTVALKVLRTELSGDETYRRRFLHEARAATEVRHRHLVPVVDVGEAEGRLFLASAFVSGTTLEDQTRSYGPLPLDDVLRAAAEVASGLDALHRAGIVHRDVKPSNILVVADGTYALTDFGLAKGRAYTVLTKPGQLVGTLDYLAPELFRGQEATPATDVYALGCVVFECLAGKPPFADRSILQIGLAHMNEEPPDPSADRADAPGTLSWAVLRALAKEPAERPPTATAYAHLLWTSAGRPARS